MSARPWTLPTLALALGASLLLVGGGGSAFSLLGHDLDLAQRDVRIFDNFADASANDNQVPHASFPGHQGSVMAIWKASVEWGCGLHGDGSGDPHQPFDLGSGGANFDTTFQGRATGVGGVNDNVHSAISSLGGGVIAITEGGGAGWRIRYNDQYDWEDGPGTVLEPGALDLQGIATRQYGFALGLGHSGVPGATMATTLVGNGVELRSIEADDAAGVQAIYGVCSPGKPVVTGIDVLPTDLVIHGQNFAPVNNEVWFTANGDGSPLKVTGVVSNGTMIQVSLPTGAGSGDLLVRNDGVGGASLSTPFPIDLGTPCEAPSNYCTSSTNSVGARATIGSTGSVSVSTADFELTVVGCPPNKSGIFYYGPNAVDLPFGEGRRCVGGGVWRLPLVVTDGAGSAIHPLDFGSPPVASGSGQIAPGDRWRFQFWYRDPMGGPAGFNTSNGLSARFCP